MSSNPTHVALSELEIDEKANVRKTNRGSEPSFVASIRKKGVIEPLTVRLHVNTGRYTITNGGKRYAALTWMQEHQEEAKGIPVTSAFPVPIVVRQEDDDDARETSLITNVVRADMHAVDRFEAFDALHQAGRTIEDIAATYALKEKEVRQSLALGALSPAVRTAWREGLIEADIAKAFTLQPDHAEQEKLFSRLKKSRNLYSHGVRKAILGDNQEGPQFLKLVGQKAYEAAGGKVISDLFTDAKGVSDLPLLKKLADEKVAARIASLEKDGWSWVKLAKDVSNRWSMERIGKKKPDFTDKDKAKSGCIVEIKYDGSLEIEYGMMPPAPKKSAAKAGAAGDGPAGDVISKAIAHRLSITLTNAAYEAMSADSPSLALAALIASFGEGMHGGPVKLHSGARTFQLRPTSPTAAGPAEEEDENFEAPEDFDEDYEAPIYSKWADLFAAALKLTLEQQLAQVAVIVANSLDFQRMNGGSALASDPNIFALCEALDPALMNDALRNGFDPADYFGGVSGALRAKAAEEAVRSDEAKKVAKMKKAASVAWCVENIPSTGWLPPELRTSHYVGPGAVKAPPQKEKAAKAPKKKAA